MIPMIGLSTAAAILASQALISGAFSLTRSASTLGLLPRFAVKHTSAQMEGQIYLPVVNWGVWAGACTLVVGFGSSSGLAAAYGLTVMGVFVVTTVSVAAIARHLWRWPVWKVAVAFTPFLVMDLSFLSANVIKIPEGAWVTLLIGGLLYFAMDAWRRFRRLLRAAYHAVPRIPLSQLVERRDELTEIPRAFVFLVSEPVRSAADPVPVLVMKFVDRYGGLPRHVTLFTVVAQPEMPYCREKRFEVDDCGGNIVSVRMHVGFMERADVRAALRWLENHDLVRVHAARWTIVVGREEFLSEGGGPLWRLRFSLVQWMSLLSIQVHEWFGLGTDAGVSKELIPVRARAGHLEIIVDRSGSWVVQVA
jgi:KUP system potassium uptake protein